MIPRFYDAFSGEVLVDGKNVKDYSIKALRGKIGVVPQKAVSLTEQSGKICSGATKTPPMRIFMKPLKFPRL